MARAASIFLLLAACATHADIGANRVMSDLVTTSHEAMACRRSVASNAHYRPIAVHMPLVQLHRATLAQMADPRFATDDESVAVALWMQDIQGCRQRLIDIILRQMPASLAIFVAGWNKEDQALVLLVRRKLAWGEAVTQLRTIEAELLSKLTDQAMQVVSQLNRAKQAELSRRVAIFDALTNLAP